jgi:predicted DNA-binding protein
MPKQPEADRLVSLSVRVSPEMAAKLRQVADSHYRPVAAHLRLLIERDVEAEAA